MSQKNKNPKIFVVTMRDEDGYRREIEVAADAFKWSADEVYFLEYPNKVDQAVFNIVAMFSKKEFISVVAEGTE